MLGNGEGRSTKTSATIGTVTKKGFLGWNLYSCNGRESFNRFQPYFYCISAHNKVPTESNLRSLQHSHSNCIHTWDQDKGLPAFIQTQNLVPLQAFPY